MVELSFTRSTELSMGVELELQLVSLYHQNLAMEAADLLRRLEAGPHAGAVKPEITQAMIELNSGIHGGFESLRAELQSMRDTVADAARAAHVGVCGGGTHPFQRWNEQRIFPTERFASVSEQYGYLAKQFTVFGQHVHIGVANGDDAIYLCHALARFIPHFIALSASSPYYQGVDTAFDCARLQAVSAFPLSGTPPWLHTWEEFDAYYQRMVQLGIVRSMKDFYWDIRPKPEYGTIELRICDTPLTVQRAAELAGYLQMLVRALLAERKPLSRDVYLAYTVNRFRAARYGFDARLIDPVGAAETTVAEDILATLDELGPHAAALGGEPVLASLRRQVEAHDNDAAWLRARMAELGSLPDVVHAQVLRWQD
ncbi:MAG: glutamate--cysteine ligase [Gammaproteobacteria bacterium]|nr:glutamate--cysteine ligase [Gammaproteobacteria bacterium]